MKFKDLKPGDYFVFPGDKTVYLFQPGKTYRLLDMTHWPFKTMQRVASDDTEVKLHTKQYVHPLNIDAPF